MRKVYPGKCSQHLLDKLSETDTIRGWSTGQVDYTDDWKGVEENL